VDSRSATGICGGSEDVRGEGHLRSDAALKRENAAGAATFRWPYDRGMSTPDRPGYIGNAVEPSCCAHVSMLDANGG
jgi:hypothetical protein